MESFSQRFSTWWPTKQQLESLSTQVKKKPQLVLGAVVGGFFLLGVVATVGLVGVQQDIRQQAALALYDATKGADCSRTPEGSQGCDSSNNLYACVGGTWRVVDGQKCVAPPGSNVNTSETPAVLANPSICNDKHPSWKQPTRTCKTGAVQNK